MDLNETKRKRSIPEWMKSPNSSPSKNLNKTNGRVGPKQQRPSYPAISIKKTKQSPKPVKDVEPHTSKSCQIKKAKPPCFSGSKEDQSLEHGACSSRSAENSAVSDSSYFMTVDELTAVAQEVINDAQRKRRLL